LNVILDGFHNNRQRYKCKDCNKKFQNNRRKRKQFLKKLWYDYVWRKQTITDLSERHLKSEKWIRGQLDKVIVKSIVHVTPQSLVVGMDATFFNKKYGILLFRSPNLKKNLWWRQIKTETVAGYRQGREYIEKHGFTIKAVVIDGKKGVRQLFSDISIQMCQYHQKKIINRYLTLNPKLEASQELKVIVKTLTLTIEKEFTNDLNLWHDKWKDFLKERTINPETGRWNYTHKRLRSAYRSLKTNSPILFTYQKYPELNIPNTNNSLEGFFNEFKSRVNHHRGLNKKRRLKVIIEVLKGKPTP